MKLHSCLTAAWLCLILITFCACASLPEPQTAEQRLGYSPEWWLYQAPDDEYVYVYGVGLGNSLEKSLLTAKNNVHDSSSKVLEEHLATTMDIFIKEAGVVDPKALEIIDKLIHAIASGRYSSAVQVKTESREVRERGRTRFQSWVQVAIPKKEIYNNLIYNLSNDAALSSLFKNSPSFRSMEQNLMQR